jgi:predicted  nucleic acid-binding Zn-ribbon protein
MARRRYCRATVTECGECGRVYEETRVVPGDPCPECGGSLHPRRFVRGDEEDGHVIVAARSSERLADRLVGIGA